MKTNRLVLLFSVPVILLVPTSCEKEEPARVSNKVVVETPEGRVVAVETRDVIWPAVEGALRSQLDALNRENIAAYMSYIHPGSAGFAATSDKLEETFRDYDLKTTLEKVEAVSLTDGEAKVHFVQLTEKLSGPAFRNNRISGTHLLRKDGGVWKLFSTEQDTIEYLDSQS